MLYGWRRASFHLDDEKSVLTNMLLYFRHGGFGMAETAVFLTDSIGRSTDALEPFLGIFCRLVAFTALNQDVEVQQISFDRVHVGIVYVNIHDLFIASH